MGLTLNLSNLTFFFWNKRIKSLFRYRIRGVLIIFYFLILMIPVFGEQLNFKAFDTPNDSGNSISIHLTLTSNYSTGRFVIYRIDEDKNEFEVENFELSDSKILEFSFIDSDVKDGVGYRYQLYYTKKSLSSYFILSKTGFIYSSPQWYHKKKTPVLIGILIYVLVLFLSIHLAKHGGIKYIRKLPGLDAIEDAVGRATEMGKPVLYLTGLERISNIATIASLDILARVSKKVAEYETPLLIPCFDPIVLIIAREIVRESYSFIGKPDIYNEENIYYITGNPFGYVAAVDGIMMREKPAANFYLGAFYSDSLILAETGASTGAIQIAGTDSPIQLPFFIAACDYTLLGEELYAASAYLSRKKELLGTLKALDIMKILIMIFIVLGSILITFEIDITGFLIR